MTQNPPFCGRKPSPHRRQYPGFTLLEMIITVTIILVLGVLSISGVRSMKKSANSVKCMSNLKNLCVAAVTASTDNNGKFPALRVFPWDPDGYLSDTGSGFYAEEKAPSIGEALGPYLGMEPVSTMDIDPELMPEVFKCPAAKRNVAKAWINRYGAYRYNYYAIGRRPSQDGMLFIDTCWNDWPKEDFSHQEPTGLNVAYADGRVEFVRYHDYIDANPASSPEKDNPFFTQGWLNEQP